MSTHAAARDARPSYATPDAPPAWLGGGRIPSLDGVRAVAILLVLYAHAHFPGNDWAPLRTLRGRCGFLGVQTFFVLSGFLITTLMLREVRRTGGLSLRGFYLRRVLRIVPAYLAFLAVVAALPLAGAGSLGGRAWLALATYTVNFLPAPLPWQVSHVWSLSVEEHFYLLWPLLVAALPPAGSRRAVAGCLVAALGLRWLLRLAWPGCPVDLWTFTRIDDIAVGCGLAFLARDASWRARLDRITGRRAVLATLLGLFLVSQVCFSNVVGGRLFGPRTLAVVLGLANDVNSFTIALLLWAVLTRPGGAAGRVLNRPLMSGVGVLSYSLYLWHPLFCEAGPAWLTGFPQNLVFIFATAGLSYGLVERPFLRWKLRLAAPAAAPAPAPADAPADARGGAGRRPAPRPEPAVPG